VTYLEVLPARTSAEVARRAEESLAHLAHDEAPRNGRAVVTLSDDVVAEVTRQAADVDLVILGLHRGSRGRREFGAIMLDIAQATRCPLLMISQRR
jgi:nucleotide-binding universal stress UspA family protein